MNRALLGRIGRCPNRPSQGDSERPSRFFSYEGGQNLDANIPPLQAGDVIVAPERLARKRNASLTYRYLHRTASAGNVLPDPATGLPASSVAPATANSIMMTIATTTTIIPHDD